MKSRFCILLTALGLMGHLHAQTWVKPAAVLPVYEEWVKKHSAGVTISQTVHPVSREPEGVVISGDQKIELGETPPFFHCQLQTSDYPIVVGEKHERRTFELHVRSVIVTQDRASLAGQLMVRYPRWSPRTGLESSGGLVFLKNETRLTKIGVIVPTVIPELGESNHDFSWQIEIRFNDRGNDVDARTKAKPQTLGDDVVVLMPTHPDKIPASSPVVWFRFEKDGTVRLLED